MQAEGRQGNFGKHFGDGNSSPGHVGRGSVGDPAAGEGGGVSLEAEVPEVLFDGMRDFLTTHPQWDQYRLITSALAGFLFQNGCNDRCVTEHYLDGLFLRQ